MSSTESFVLYPAVSLVSASRSDPVTVSASRPCGAWFHSEVVEVDRSQCSERVQRVVLPFMRRIPGTHVLHEMDLREQFRHWLVEQGWSGQPLELRVPEESAGEARWFRHMALSMAPGTDVRIANVEIDQARISEFSERCGGECRGGEVSVLRSIGYAVCDSGRREPVGNFQTDTFALLIGIRNARSLQAWIRRNEETRLGVAAANDHDPVGAVSIAA